MTYKLRLPDTVNIHPIFHVGLLKAAHDGREYPHQPLPSSKDDGEYEVEKIVSHKKRKDGKVVYLVKWQGYSYEECTWEPAKHFKPTTLRAYHAARKEAKANETDSSSEDEEDPVLAAAGTAPNPHRGAVGSMKPMKMDIDPSRPNEQAELLNLADSAPARPMEGIRFRGKPARQKSSTQEPTRKNHTVCMAAVDEQFI